MNEYEIEQYKDAAQALLKEKGIDPTNLDGMAALGDGKGWGWKHLKGKNLPDVAHSPAVTLEDRITQAACELWVLCRNPIDSKAWGRVAWDRYQILQTPGIINGVTKIKAKQAGESPAWHTKSLIEMCRVLRVRYPNYTAKEMFNALPEQPVVSPIEKIKKSDLDTLLIGADRSTAYHDKDIELKTFQSFCSKHRDKIGKRKHL